MMSGWKAKATDTIADVIRLTIWVTLTLNGLILAIASVYFTFRITVQLIMWLNKVLPW